MRTTRSRWTAVVVAGLAVALVGCGTSSHQNASPTSARPRVTATSTSTSTASTTTTTTVPLPPEGWRVLPPSPIGLGALGVWTGHEYLGAERGCCDALDGTEVSAFSPSTNTWRRLASFPLAPRRGEVFVWTGHEMIVVGGGTRPDPMMSATVPTATGAALDPVANRWRVIAPMPSAMGAPTGAVWTGTAMIVFDANHTYLYDPVADRWREGATPTTARWDPTVVWDGNEMLVWSGRDAWVQSTRVYGDGAAYNPTTDRWRSIPAAPVAARWLSGAVWTGDEMFVWGGAASGDIDPVLVGQPAAYNPATNTWRKLALSPLRARTSHMMLWTGHEVVIWGGRVDTASHVPNAALPHDGAAFDPATNTWRKLPPTPASETTPITTDTAVWTGKVALFMGGQPTDSQGDGPLALEYTPGR